VPGDKESDPAYRAPEIFDGILDGIYKENIFFIHQIQDIRIRVIRRTFLGVGAPSKVDAKNLVCARSGLDGMPSKIPK
jgi:hypothetical protein